MEILKKNMAVLLVLVLTLSMGACQQDCEDAIQLNQCRKKFRALEEKIKNNDYYPEKRIEGMISCEELNEEVESLYNECKNAITPDDKSYLLQLISYQCES